MKNNRGLIVSAVLVLLLFSAVIPVGCIQPAKADTKNSLTVQLNNIGGGITSLTNQTTHSSSYAAKLVIPSSAEQGSGCLVLYPYNKTLNSLQSFQIYTSYTNASPRFVILLDTSGDGLTDIALLSDYQFAGNGSWVKTEGGQRWGWTEASPQLSFYGKAWNTTGNWKSVYGNATVLSVGVALEYWAVKDTNGFDQPLYADEAVINGVTYTISNQPPPNVSSTDDWPMYRHDPQRTGITATTPVTSNALLWQFTMGGDKVRSSPSVANGIVYEGSNDGYIYALNAANGSMVWKFYSGNAAIESTPAIVNGIVYIGLLYDVYNAHVIALNANDGTLIWSCPTGGGMESSPTVVDGVVYIGTYASHLYALNAYTGELIWFYPTGGQVFSSPAVVDGVVYVGAGGGYVHAINATKGTAIWTFHTSSDVYSSPAVVNNVVYVGSDDGTLFALRATDGSQIWQVNIGVGDHADGSPAVGNGIVYFGSRNGYYAFNASTGSQMWFFTSPYSSRQLTGYMYSSPAIVGNIVYVGSPDYYVFALNAFNGSMKWSYHTGGFLFTSPAIANGVLYIGSYDGKIYAIGNWVGQTPTPTPVNSVSTPAPTPAPTASPTATAQPDPTAKPASNQAPTEDPTSPPITEHVKKQVLAEQASIDWLVLAAVVVIGAISLISMVLVYRPNKNDR